MKKAIMNKINGIGNNMYHKELISGAPCFLIHNISVVGSMAMATVTTAQLIFINFE